MVMRYLVYDDLCNCLNRISAAVADGIDCVVQRLQEAAVQRRLLLSMAVVTGFAEVRGVHLVPIRLLKKKKNKSCSQSRHEEMRN